MQYSRMQKKANGVSLYWGKSKIIQQRKYYKLDGEKSGKNVIKVDRDRMNGFAFHNFIPTRNSYIYIYIYI